MRITKNRYYSLTSKAFSPENLDHLSTQILSSCYLGYSQLSDSFAGTKGFSIVFTRAGISQVENNFPAFGCYLRTALKSNCNAFYLNPLILEAGGRVSPHIDCSISEYSQCLTIANIVSVLYILVPSDLEGGELILTKRDECIGKIVPQINTLLYFKGNLAHSVNEVKSKQIRISLVCEQYSLSNEILKLIPNFKVISGNKIY